MLSFIRKQAKSWFIKAIMWAVVVGFVGTIFLVYGRGGDDSQGPALAALVDGTAISSREFEVAYRNTLELYRKLYRGSLGRDWEERLNLRAQVLEDMINRRLALREGERLGFSVSETELAQAISQYPAFQEGGRFSERRYRDVLSRSRLNPEQFEESQRQQMLLNKVERLIKDSAVIDEGEMWDYYLLINEKIGVKFFRLSPARFLSQIKPKEELTRYFEANKNSFRTPAKVKIEYMHFSPLRLAKEVKLDKGRVELYYRRNPDEFRRPRRVKLRHILIKTKIDASPLEVEQARRQAEEILKRARKGEDFARLAKRHSKGPEAESGGDLGWFSPGQMTKNFETVAFSLKPGQVAEPLKTDLGFSLIKVDKVDKGGTQPLAKVRTKITDALKLAEGKRRAERVAEEAYALLIQGDEFAAVADNVKAPLKVTPMFSRQGKLEGIEAANFYEAAFSLSQGLFSPIVRTDEGYYLLRLISRVSSRMPKLDEVKSKVLKDYKDEQAEKLAGERAELLLARLKKGENWDKLVAKEGLKTEKSRLFSRSDLFVPQLGSNSDLIKAAFSLTSKEPYPERPFKVNGQFYVFAYDRRELPKRKEFDKVKDSLREQYLLVKREEVWARWLESLKKDARIEVKIDVGEIIR